MSQSISMSLFASQVTVAPSSGGWFALLLSAPDLPQAQEQCASQLRLFGKAPIIERSPASVEEFISSCQENKEQILLLSELDHFTEMSWSHIDAMRSRLMREGNVVLLLSHESMKRLSRNAPNLMSWIGSYVWTLSPEANDLSPEQIEQRLFSLRRWSGHDDQWVLEAAQNKTLPSDPEYAEWLVLLDRGDLLVR